MCFIILYFADLLKGHYSSSEEYSVDMMQSQYRDPPPYPGHSKQMAQPGRFYRTTPIHIHTNNGVVRIFISRLGYICIYI